MNSIEEQLNNVDWKKSTEVISFYESNTLYFNNFEQIDNPAKISDFIKIKLHYANSLFKNSQFDKTLEILEQVKKLLTKLDSNHEEYNASERYVRFLKGMTLGNMKNFKDSYPIFKELVREDPGHHYYQTWYNHTRLGLYNWIFNAVSFAGLALVILDLFSLINKTINLPPIIGNIGLAIVLISYITQKGIAEYFKRKKKKIQ